MRRQIWMCGTVVAGVATLASAAGYADDKRADALPGPINSLSDLQDTAKLVFKLADTNNDDQISQKEAIDAGNLLVGGFFFRADANGDGVLTAQEAQQAVRLSTRSSPCSGSWSREPRRPMLRREISPKMSNRLSAVRPTILHALCRALRLTPWGRSATCWTRTATRRSRPANCVRRSKPEYKRSFW